jgi:3-oxoacyl-[acyl-carrier-protein] synthase II
MISQRVVITGIGTVHPFGFGWKPLWQNILANHSAIRPIDRFNTEDLRSNVAACINYFDPADFDLGRRMNQNDLCAQYAAAALKLAFDDASLDLEKEYKQDIGIIMGNCCGGAATLENQLHKFFERGQKATSPWSIPRIMSSSSASVCARLFALGGPNITINTACSSSINAIGQAFEMVQSGKFPVIVSGGTEAPIVPHLVAGFGAMGALAAKSREQGNDATCRPFDKRRTGFVLGEGCALVVLESLEHALNRGANIYGEIVSYASFCDISHPVLPDMSGQAAARTMKSALDKAEISPEMLGYIHAHGTGTIANDVMETRGIKLVFEEAAYKIPISSSKGAIGHLLGGAGAIGVVMTVLALNHQILPPTVNLEQQDCECDLDYIQGSPRNSKVEWAMTNAFGFGGNNACLVLRRYASATDAIA